MLAVAIAATTAGLAFDCLALGLGKPLGEPVLGEALHLEIPLTGTVDRPVDGDCVAVRRSGEAIEEDYLPRDLTVRVDRQGAAARLVLSTRAAVRQPLVEFRVVVSCGYNLASDYLLAVSPPRPGAATKAATDGPAVAALAKAAPAAGRALPDGLSATDYSVEQAMTLQQLARKHFPGPLRQERFIRWVIEANPGLSARGAAGGQTKLAPGTSLLLPVGVPPRRPGDHSSAGTASDVSTPASSPAEAKSDAPAATAKAAAARGDRLVVGSGGSRRDLRETMALVDRLAAMAEQQMAAQTAATEKIQVLENAVAELNKTLSQMDAAAREREAKLQLETDAVKKQLADQADQGWWQLLLGVLGGALAGGGLAYFLRQSADRRSALRADALAIEPVAVAAHEADTSGDVQQAIIDSFGDATMTAAADASMTATYPNGTGALIARPTAAGDNIVLEPPQSLSSPASGPASEGLAPSDPATAAIELANIMTSMGLSESAAQTLVEHIRENPRQSLHHWLKLLDLHRLNGNRDDFERSTEEMRQYFNVRSDDWDRTPVVSPRSSLENYTHIRAKLIELWRQSECVQFLQSLLMDNREGTRTGFPLPVAEEILLLIAIQSNA